MPFEPGEHDSQLWIPDDARASVVKDRGATVVIDNQTDLDDTELLTYFSENTAMFGFGEEARFMSYPSEGTMMARSKWRPPRNVIEEIGMARELAERDDDIAATMGAILAAAYGEGYKNQHEDEQVEHTFEEMSHKDTNLQSALQELHRELLISSQINSVTLFVRGSYDIRPENVSRVINRSVAAPLIGVLPAERIRVLGSDMFGQGQLAYIPEGSLMEWLRQFWGQSTSPAKKRDMRLGDPIAAALFTGPVKVPWNEDMLSSGMILYALNPEMVQRSTFPKGNWRYPRPLLTRDMSLLEAKRLLNVMDHAMLQGGINFIVVAKKGSDTRPATNPELRNLYETVQRSSRSGVLIGDHRISVEIVQPDLKEMLNAEKRQMLGRKLSQAILRVPEFGSDDTGAAVQTFTETMQKVITNDRRLVIEHVERHIWHRCMQRNAGVFGRGDAPVIWTPKIILQGLDFWTQYLLKLYDRGDLPRKYMVEFGGYDYDAVKAQKEREVENGHDDIFMPPAVPFSSPNQGNQPSASPADPYKYAGPAAPKQGAPDNGPGRPRGAGNKNGNTPSPSRAKRTIRRTRGETVKAYWSEDENQTVRIGELTDRVIGEYPQATLGRITAAEQTALDAHETTNAGNVVVVPVNVGTEIDDVSAVRLEEGFSMLCGHRVPDGAVMATAFCFRQPGYALHEAEDMVIRWGFPIALVQADSIGDDDILQCPSCGEDNPASNDACSVCSFDGPPFSTPPNLRVIPQQPIALTVNVNGEAVTVDPPKSPVPAAA